MMNLLTPDTMPDLTDVNQSPCISLYMPTHERHPENQIDPKKFKDLVKQILESLLKKLSSSQADILLEPLNTLAGDFDFWQHTAKGLAVLRNKDLFEVIGMHTPVEELVVVADSFHTKPLRNYLQTLERYQILAVSLQDVQFYEGNRHSLKEVDLIPEVPATITEALGEELTQKYINVSATGAGPHAAATRHGHGSKSDEVDKDAERFFTVISRAVTEHYSNESKLPLILAALPEHHNLFHRVSNNPYLLTNGITINPKSVTIDKLKKLAWEVIEPEYFKRLDEFAQRFQVAKANGIGSDTLEEVARAAVEGRVDTLLLELDRVIPGRINKETGEISSADLQNPKIDDLLDDIGELVSANGGEVVIVPVDRMPTFTGIAAIFRY